eukprot:2904347-Prymnesium_polylepis.1
MPESARCAASPALEGGEGSPLHPTQLAAHLLTCDRACPLCGCDRPDGSGGVANRHRAPPR